MDGQDINETIVSPPGNFRKYYQNIYDALINSKPLLVDPKDAMNTIKIIEIASESANKKCTLPMEIIV